MSKKVPLDQYQALKRGRLLGIDYVKPRIDTGEATLVQQQFKDEVDVNNIVRRFGLGRAPALAPGGMYGDFTGITDYASAFAAIQRADDSFMKLTPEAREKFGNDPAQFLDYASRVGEAELLAFCGIPLPAQPATVEAPPEAAP